MRLKKSFSEECKRILMITAAAVLMAVNMKSFVRTGGLIPGGFSGLTRLIQEISVLLWQKEPPFSLILWGLNVVPAIISYRTIGKKFTLYSCLMVLLSGFLTDLIPAYPVTEDILLVSVFGGLLHAVSIGICLWADATGGGTDFFAVYFARKKGIDTWNYIFAANVAMLAVAGWLFGWDKALYSIIFQFTMTQVLQALYKRYQKQTMLIVTKKPEELYVIIRDLTNHDATLLKGIGCFKKEECSILYSVVGRDEVRKVVNCVKQADPDAFVNMIRTERLSGRFYQRPNT